MMFSVVSILSLAVYCEGIKLKAQPYEPKLVEEVNNAKTTWTAHESPRFHGATIEDVRNLCGTFLEDPIGHILTTKRHGAEVESMSIPESFDTREKWPKCASVIGHVRDQASCGSCWAFGSTAAFNDRLCISTDGEFNKLLSVQETAACCNLQHGCFSFGCSGGNPSDAWYYFKKDGVVTGGDNPDKGTGTTCYPYEIEMCAHHVEDPVLKPCTDDGNLGGCKSSCTEKAYPVGFKEDKHHASSSYSLSSVEDIQRDLMTNGPVTAAFSVYSDFPTYHSGVYQHQTGSMLGGHAVKIIGWGVENSVPYWLVQNSWNAKWGDKGRFKILRGQNECGIEGQISAGEVAKKN